MVTITVAKHLALQNHTKGGIKMPWKLLATILIAAVTVFLEENGKK